MIGRCDYATVHGVRLSGRDGIAEVSIEWNERGQNQLLVLPRAANVIQVKVTE